MNAARVVVSGLLGLCALNAFGGGVYGLLGARGVRTAWLAGSPFRDYFVPSLVLFVVVGGSCGAASVAVWRRARRARGLAAAACLIVFAWLATQVAIIGYVSWLQPATAAVAAAIALGLPFLSRRSAGDDHDASRGERT